MVTHDEEGRTGPCGIEPTAPCRGAGGEMGPWEVGTRVIRLRSCRPDGPGARRNAHAHDAGGFLPRTRRVRGEEDAVVVRGSPSESDAGGFAWRLPGGGGGSSTAAAPFRARRLRRRAGFFVADRPAGDGVTSRSRSSPFFEGEPFGWAGPSAGPVARRGLRPLGFGMVLGSGYRRMGRSFTE